MIEVKSVRKELRDVNLQMVRVIAKATEPELNSDGSTKMIDGKAAHPVLEPRECTAMIHALSEAVVHLLVNEPTEEAS